jgi:polyisoprenoid-binding protein YceI
MLDPTTSSACFAVKHMTVATFSSRFGTFDANLEVTARTADLRGTVDVSSLVVHESDLSATLRSPDFFDLDRYRKITYRSTSIQRQDDELLVDGELTIKGNAQTIRAVATTELPGVAQSHAARLRMTLVAVIDRTQFGLSTEAPSAAGLADDVELTVELDFIRR